MDSFQTMRTHVYTVAFWQSILELSEKEEVKLTRKANKLFVKSIGHQRLRKAPSDSERKRRMGGEGWEERDEGRGAEIAGFIGSAHGND